VGDGECHFVSETAGLQPERPAEWLRTQNPVKDDVTHMRAAVLASPKIVSLPFGRGDCDLLRHGIIRTAIARHRNGT